MSNKLTYFPIRGLAEDIRLLLNDNNIAFEDAYVSFTEWGNVKWDAAPLFGQVPIYEENGKKLFQSKAILRHLARGLGLTGKTEEEAYHIDMVFEHLADVRRAYSGLAYSNEFETKKEQYFHTTLPQLLKPLETLLDGKQYIAGDYISFADYTLYELIEANSHIAPEILTNFPNLAAHLTRIENRPGIKDYIANRRPKFINGASAAFNGWKA